MFPDRGEKVSSKAVPQFPSNSSSHSRIEEVPSFSTSSEGCSMSESSPTPSAEVSTLTSCQPSLVNKSSPNISESLCISDISAIRSPSSSLVHSQPSNTTPSTSTPNKSSPVVKYPIQRLRLGSQELGPPPNVKKSILKVLPLAKQLVVDCGGDGDERVKEFVIEKSNTAQLFLGRFESGGWLLSWDPIPNSVGSFDSYRTLQLVLARGTIDERRFACKMSEFFKTSFQVVC